MSSRFPFIRPRTSPQATPAASAAPPVAATLPANAPVLAAANAESVAEAVAQMLAALRQFLENLPAASVSATSISERPLALGNWRGMDRRGSFAMTALKGGRVEAGVRFQFSAATPEEVDGAVTTLQTRLLDASDDLFRVGFLRLTAEDASLAEPLSSTNTWRKTATYRILYEYHYVDQDGAESIIARIPITNHLETLNGLGSETTTVTDAMVRWDDEEAPVLEVTATIAARTQINGMAILAYLPAAWSGAPVTFARLNRRTAVPPTVYTTIDEFLSAVTHAVAPDRNAQVTFDSVAACLAAFQPAGEAIALGDWDENGFSDLYQPGVLPFPAPLWLNSSDDRLQISYQASAFDAPGVVYLRVEASKK